MNTDSKLHKLRTNLPAQFMRFRILTFVVAVALVFGFVILREYTLNNAPVSPQAVSSKLDTVKNPQIDPATITKIDQLQDNSVSVRALFDQARQNPFRE